MEPDAPRARQGTPAAGAARPYGAPDGERGAGVVPPGGLLDLLGVCAVVLDGSGRIVFWSPQADRVFGYTAEEALGRYASRLLVHEEHRELVTRLFGDVLTDGEAWAGAFPVRHKDGGTRLVEFRNMRLRDTRGEVYALGIAADQPRLQSIERDLALSDSMVAQTPVGLAVLDAELRYLLVNPALEAINGRPAAEHLGRRPRDILPFLDTVSIESAMRQVLRTGTPVVDQYAVGRPPDDPDRDHAWSVSYFRLAGPGGRVVGVAASVIDVSERHRAATEVDRARRRLALVADASARVGTSLQVEQTAQELAEVSVPELADVAAVDILDDILSFRRATAYRDGPQLFRALAVAAAYATEATGATDEVGELAAYGADRLVTRCVQTRLPVLVPRTGPDDLRHIARDAEAAAALARAGVHSYLVVPLIARNEVLGAFGLLRARNPLPFTEDDALLAMDLAGRAAVAVDNARWHQSVRNAAETLQRSLLPGHPTELAGLEVASHYQPAQSSSEVGGDWYDVIPLSGDRTALVVGDVMGSGIDAAATMGQLRTATSAYADLELPPDQILRHLDRITAGLEQSIATCLYAVYDPHRHRVRIANAGHLPPVLIRAGSSPELVGLPTGAPLGVGGVTFVTTSFELAPGDRLVLYTDGLVETRHHAIDERLDALLRVLDESDRPLHDTCGWLLEALRHPGDHDDVALLIAEAHALP
ncbi:SpoIIE family protein phosphatase [Streptomyces sp. NPDC058045]|uniref:SpoIIE family protein phosphatase n=1 Tax=Streptomyces sp. NPDC058045 TaxID=3346311 RepID=UPI0036E901DB